MEKQKESSVSLTKITPLMQQYFSIKRDYSEALLFFQVGDFYELFYDDAVKASQFLAITLTKRGKSEGVDIPLCGVPVHALHHYLIKLIKGGFKVAIADQVTKPVPGQVVERKVTRYITPGTLLDEYLMDHKHPSYLCIMYPDQKAWGLLFTELLSAQTFITKIPEGSPRLLEAELTRFFPDEILMPSTAHAELQTMLKQKGFLVSTIKPEEYTSIESENSLYKQLSVSLQKQLEREPVLLKTVYILEQYIAKNHALTLEKMQTINLYEVDDYLMLDAATQKNLDIIPLGNQKREHTLLGVLDQAVTAMGSRMIKKWLLRPLKNKIHIAQRQAFAFFLKQNYTLLKKFRLAFAEITDLERIVGRIALCRATNADYLSLLETLSALPLIKELLYESQSSDLARILYEKIVDFSIVTELLQASINDDKRESWLIKSGFDFELDQVRATIKNGQDLLLQLEQEEITKTGINSLKLRYTDLYGYAFEVTKTHEAVIPQYFILQQALSNRNRYVTVRLKELEQEIKNAHAMVEQIEKKVFERIATEVATYSSALRHAAQALAMCDAIASFGYSAYMYNYVVPTFNEEKKINIESGRHPIVEQTTINFIANDTVCNQDAQVHIVTGPNMGGKSTYLRQVGLIHIMAQIGSLVPAKKADISLLDALFTRIGSGDDLASGKSTFLVEMEETAIICTQATQNSLVILDEVGRGTSTYDGMALAHAIIEYLATTIKTRALFATHYHELTRLEGLCPGVINVHCQVQKMHDNLIFLHKIQRGVAAGSFGLEVARLAQLPASIIDRAQEVLQELSSTVHAIQNQKIEPISVIVDKRSNFVIDALQSVALDELTPRQALDFLYELKKKITVFRD
jgi:DNA mismatch repair protein MutS